MKDEYGSSPHMGMDIQAHETCKSRTCPCLIADIALATGFPVVVGFLQQITIQTFNTTILEQPEYFVVS